MNKKGFTLIELLTTMTIIAVLAGLALVSFQGARKTGRDGKRKSDLEQIRSALEMCYAEDNQYPASISIDGSVICDISHKIYLTPTPTDPSTGLNYYYNCPSNTTYTLCATLELNPPNNCGINGNYQVTNP